MVPQVALAAMLIEGVFERHPGLVLIVEELGITWLPHFITTIDSITTGPHGANFGMGPGDYRTKDYMRIGGGMSLLYVTILVTMTYVFYL